MKSFIILLLFLIPIVWSSYVNANYLSTKTFLIYVTSGLAFMALPDDLNLRQIPKKILWLLLAIFLYYVGSIAWEQSLTSVFYVFKMLSFVSVTLFVYSLSPKIGSVFEKTSYLFFLMWATILGLTGYEIFRLRILDENIQTMAVLSTFGNVNMMSEFFVLSVPFFFLWLQFGKDRIPYYLKLFGLFLVSFIILYGRSRSAWIGLIAWFLFKAYKNQFNWKEYTAFAAALVLFFVSHITAPDASKISKLTHEAFSERASLYKGSLQLLSNRPFGIPMGQFMNEIVPYLIDKESPPNEFAFFDQPHSEFLKWGIQFGWLFLFLCILFFVFLAYELRRKQLSEPNINEIGNGPGRSLLNRPGSNIWKESFFYVEFLIVLFPEMVFQFPFENPASIVVMAVAFGMFLASYPEGIKLNLRYFQYLLGSVGFICIVNGFLFISSIHLESAFSPSADVMNVVCNYYPINFRACYWRDRSLLTNKLIPAFRNEFKKDFRANPFYCDNMRLLPEYFNYGASQKKTCEALLIYKDLYRTQTNFAPEAFAPCAAFSNPLTFHDADQWTSDFKKWFENGN
jgi:hypothetical protein